VAGASTYWQRSAYPGQRSLIPGRIGREGPGAQHPAHLIHRRGPHLPWPRPCWQPTAALIAASSAATDDPAEADSLDDLGEELKQAIATPGPRYGLGRAEQAVQRAEHPAWNLTSVAAAGVYPNVALKSCRWIRGAVWLAGPNSGYVGAGRTYPRARRREPVSLAVDWHGLGRSGGARRAGTVRLGATCGRRRR
jgi:hypothetical protein